VAGLSTVIDFALRRDGDRVDNDRDDTAGRVRALLTFTP
jgi:hypothetical protein